MALASLWQHPPTPPTTSSSLLFLSTIYSLPSSASSVHFLFPSWPYCTSSDMFDPCTAVSWPQCYWLQPSVHLLCFHHTHSHLSIISLSHSAEQSLDGIHKIYDSWFSLTCECWWEREKTEKEKEKERDKDWRRRGACRWHSWIMTISMIDSLCRVGCVYCVCVCVCAH